MARKAKKNDWLNQMIDDFSREQREAAVAETRAQEELARAAREVERASQARSLLGVRATDTDRQRVKDAMKRYDQLRAKLKK